MHLLVSVHLFISAKGYSVPRAFIAAQSPMSHTKGDFWELVWQFRTPTIVLLTNVMEGRQVRVFGLLLSCDSLYIAMGMLQFNSLPITV